MLPTVRSQIGSLADAILLLRFKWPTLRNSSALILLGVSSSALARAQCSGIASTPAAAAGCAAGAIPQNLFPSLDAAHTYSLAELIDLAERTNPRTRVAWERARQRAEDLGIARSAYYPVLAGQGAFSDARSIFPFPKPLAPRGYVMIEVPAIVPSVTLDYLIFDFGKREAHVDAAM